MSAGFGTHQRVPVVDDDGRCVGMLSATDFVQWAGESGKADPPVGTPVAGYYSDWQMVDLDALPGNEVRAYMSTDLVTAEPSTLITNLARWMLYVYIHHIIVLDERRRPIGIVTSTDILAAVAYAERFETHHAEVAAL